MKYTFVNIVYKMQNRFIYYFIFDFRLPQFPWPACTGPPTATSTLRCRWSSPRPRPSSSSSSCTVPSSWPATSSTLPAFSCQHTTRGWSRWDLYVRLSTLYQGLINFFLARTSISFDFLHGPLKCPNSPWVDIKTTLKKVVKD